MQTTQPLPAPGRPDDREIHSYGGLFYAIPVLSDWAIYYTGYSSDGQLIGRLIDGRFHVNPETNINIEPIDDTLELLSLFMHCLKRAAILPLNPNRI